MIVEGRELKVNDLVALKSNAALVFVKNFAHSRDGTEMAFCETGCHFMTPLYPFFAESLTFSLSNSHLVNPIFGQPEDEENLRVAKLKRQKLIDRLLDPSFKSMKEVNLFLYPLDEKIELAIEYFKIILSLTKENTGASHTAKEALSKLTIQSWLAHTHFTV